MEFGPKGSSTSPRPDPLHDGTEVESGHIDELVMRFQHKILLLRTSVYCAA